jgi:NifB/MoaA-like Fe-S oxidoreductase
MEDTNMSEVRENEIASNAGVQEAEYVANIDAEKAGYVQDGLITEYGRILRMDSLMPPA